MAIFEVPQDIDIGELLLADRIRQKAEQADIAGDEATFVQYATGDWRMIGWAGAVLDHNHTSLAEGGLLSGINPFITLATEQASTSGTAIDFTSIPTGTKRITIIAGIARSATKKCIIISL